MRRTYGPILALAVLLGGCTRGDDVAVMSGYAEAELVYVAAGSAGTLRRLPLQRGDAVREGQLLFTLDDDAEALAVAAAAARRQRAEAQAANLRAPRRPVEIEAIDAQLAQARSALAASTSQYERQRRLVEQGFLAPLRLDELLAARDRDAARLRELQAQRALALAAARSDEVAAAAAEARAGQADAELARWRQAQRERRAPRDAVVHDLMYRVGEWVPAGAPVVALLPPAALRLRFFVPQPRLAEVAVGATVGVACDGCPSGLTGRVSWVSAQAEYTPPVIYSNASRAKLVFMAEATPDDAVRAVVKPGQPLDVRLSAAPRDSR